MNKPIRCVLKCLDGSSDDIELDKVVAKVILGRGPLTKIIDKCCSRSQVLIELNAQTHLVKLKQLGSNHSGLNGEALVLNEERVLNDGDVVEVLHNCFKYKVEFDGVNTLHGLTSNASNGEGNSDDEKIVTSPIEKAPCSKRAIDTGGNQLSKCEKKFKLCDNSDALDFTMKGSWDYIDNGKLLVYTSQDVCHKSKIAAFDLDGTLVTTKSGKVFPVDTHDWKLLFGNVKSTLNKYVDDDYKIVIFTNQGGIEKKKIISRDFQRKAESIIKAIGVPVQMFVATHNDKYRKPVLGMWECLSQEKNGDIAIDISESFYVGDAAGRAANWAPKKKKDFACTDYLFALNLNLKFFTPEQLFLKEKPPEFSNLPIFNPREVYQNSQDKKPPQIPHDKKQAIIMIGSQGSGKSYFVTTYLKPLNYTIVNRDTLGSWQKCLSVMNAALESGMSVVVDNTNPDRESRQRFIEAARKHGVRCVAVLMNIGKEHAKHNIKFRELTDSSHIQIPDIIINSYFTKFQPPQPEEGFDSIMSVDFIPRKFSSLNHEKLYQMYLLDK